MTTPISRRTALRTFAGAAAALASVRPSAATDATAKSSFRHSACKWCYRHISLETLAATAKEIGLESIELLEPKDAPVLNKFGLTCAMGLGRTTIAKGINRIEHHAEFVPATIERIKECAEVGYPNVLVSPGNRAGMSDEQGLENCVVAIKQFVGTAEKHGITVCMELLNSKVNHPDHMCDRTSWGVELAKRVGSERFKLLYDIYHMQIMEGDVIRTIQESHQYIAHYHTAGNPGRNEFEPQDQQELNYRPIMHAIKATGFKGFVAQEFIPKHDPLTSLREAVKLCTV